ncbi:MAG: hypothetical protein AAFX93_20350 [Verrucomicrobiota bacterium]
MKITIARSNGRKNSRLTLKEIKLMLTIVPDDWKTGFNKILINNRHSGCVTVSRYLKRIIISDQNASDIAVAHRLFSELGEHHLSEEMYGQFGRNKISKTHRKELEGSISKLVDQYREERELLI